MANEKLVKIADNWSALSEAERIALFEQVNYMTPTTEQLKETFGDEPFQIVTLYDSDIESLDDYIVTATPKPEFIKANTMIYVENKNNISSVEVSAEQSETANIRLLATIDGTEYKTYYDNEWIPIDINDIERILAIGLTPESIAKITTEQWATLTSKFGLFSQIGFGYILDKESSSDTCSLSTIIVNLINGVDGELTNFKFVCVGYSPDGKYKFVADRNIQTGISWETLTAEELCTSSGRDMSYSKTSPTVILRLPNSALSREDTGEWDAIIAAEDAPVHPADSEYWHTGIASWTLDTPINADDAGTAAVNSSRIARGGTAVDTFTNLVSTTANSTVGYRPIMLAGEKQEEVEYIPPINLTTIKNIANSVPGNALTCEYSAATTGTVGRFSNLTKANKDLIADAPGDTPNGSFSFVHVGYTPSGAYKFIADRNLQGKISWETLNTAGYCTTSGVDAESLTGIKGSYMRLIQSHVSNKNMDKTSSEWDTIMRKSTIGNTNIPSDWNIYKTKSWTLNTPSEADDAGTPAVNSSRIARGCEADDDSTITRCIFDSNAVYAGICFRPVLIVPLDKQSALVDITATPTYINSHNVNIESTITPFKDGLDMTTCSVRVLLNDTEIVKEREYLTDNTYNTAIDNSVFAEGENILKVIYTVDNIDNEYEIVIFKESLSKLTKIRDFKNYTGGFNLNNNIISDSGEIISDSIKLKINNATDKMIIPNNTVKITLAEN